MTRIPWLIFFLFATFWDNTSPMLTSPYGYCHQVAISSLSFREKITFLFPGVISSTEYFLWHLTGYRDYMLLITSFHKALVASFIPNSIIYLFSTLSGRPITFPWICLEHSLVAESLHFLTIFLILVWIPVSFSRPFLIWDNGFFFLPRYLFGKRIFFFCLFPQTHLFRSLWQFSSPFQ